LSKKVLNSVLIGFLFGVGAFALYSGITNSSGISWVSLIIIAVLITALTKKKSEDKE